MTQYVIKMSNGYIFPALKGGFPVFTRSIEVAQRFDSVTEAELFALAYGLGRYTVQPTPLQEEPMFERFTDRSRKVIQLANQEALRLGHDQVQPVHLLTGLAMEGSGIGANVLKNLDVSLDKIREEVSKVTSSWAHHEIMGQFGKLPGSDASKGVYQRAIDSATSLGHTYVGTEHLLLGLLVDKDGIPARVLTSLRVTKEEVEEEIHLLLGVKPATRDPNVVHRELGTLDQLLTKAKSEGGLQELRTILVAALAIVDRLTDPVLNCDWGHLVTAWGREPQHGVLKVFPPDSDVSSILKAPSETTGEQSG